MLKFAIVLFCVLGLYALLYALGIFQSSAFPVLGHGISWAILVSGLFGLIAVLKIRT